MAIDVVPTVVYSSMLGVTVFALLENTNRPKQPQTIYLSALFVLLLTHILGELYIHSGFYRYAPAIAGLEFPLRTLMGPALYFYAVATMSPDNKLSVKAYLLALVGPLSVFVIMLPFLFGISAEQKLALASPATRDPVLWQIAFYTCLASMVVFIGCTGIYLVATLQLHTKHRSQLLERFSSIEQRSMDWFKWILLFWGGAWLLYATEYALGFIGLRWFGSGIVLPVVEALVLLAFAHLAIKQPILTDSERGKPNVAPFRTASLEDKKMREIANALNTAMVEDNLFMEEDLSLRRLSEAITVSENHISETLSQHLNSNFFNFVNGYRIQAAKSQLLSTNKQVTAIAFDVGFNSKSTFNTAFKKIVGCTPTTYRNQQAA